MNEDKAIVIGGKHGEIIARQKSDADLELGELLVSEDPESGKKILLQVNDIMFGSQISRLNIEKISGYSIEGVADTEFINNNLRNYKLAVISALVSISKGTAYGAKDLPKFFSTLRKIEKQDLEFLGHTDKGLFLGYIRSGTKKLEVPVLLDGEKVLSHHLLITGTTGKGKSVLMKNLIWSTTSNEYASMLIFDPHDEYYGRKNPGMKDFPEAEKIMYYTPKNVPPGQRSLKINLDLIRPDHFDFLELSSPQRQIMYLFYKKYREKWISSLLKYDIELAGSNEVNEMSLAVLRRRIKILLDLEFDNDRIISSGIFDEVSGKTNIKDIISGLENGKTIIVDTSNFSGNAELLVASMIATELFIKYKRYNMTGEISSKPVVNIVLEEAPRVIGREILEQGPNIFSTIAREGRKFRIGLSAITQLPSLIPKEILANLNTKIILGTEMNSERQALIESASQDLSTQNRAIAGLDKGEAIISTNFAPFAIPVAIPFFDDEIKKAKHDKKNKNHPETPVRNSYSGINIS